MSTDEGGLFGGGGIISWNWDFGDTNSSTSPSPKHQYARSGIYTIRLTVTDGDGETHSVQKQITVQPSLDGDWTGYIEDAGGTRRSMDLEFSHSTSGGIQGEAYLFNQRYTCDGISFNPTSKQVRFTILGQGIRLEGTLDASETRIVGNWFNLATQQQMWSWDVEL